MKLAKPRSRNGCKTCRLRRIRCDEAVPSCRRCTETGRVCDGPTPDRIVFKQYNARPAHGANSTVAAPLLVGVGHLDTPQEARAFSFYMTRAAPSFSGSLDGYFWSTLLPQISHYDLSVKHAVLAISTLYENPLLDAYRPPPRGIEYTTDQRRAIGWYSRALRNTVARASSATEVQQLEIGLLTCLLFTSIELQHANVFATVTLLTQGFGLVARYLELTSPNRSHGSPWVRQILLPLLIRQTVVFGVFGHPLPSQLYAVIDSIIPGGSTPLATMAEARENVYAILIRSFRFVHTATLADLHDPEVKHNLELDQRHLVSWLAAWSNEIHHLHTTQPLTNQQKSVYHTLLCHKSVAYLWVSRSLNRALYQDDEEHTMFREILFHAKLALDLESPGNNDGTRAPFVFELGVMPPLMFVGWQCPDMQLCRQAVALMRRGPMQESVFVTELQVAALEKIIAVEEQMIEASPQDSEEVSTLATGNSRQSRPARPSIDRSLGLPRSRHIIEEHNSHRGSEWPDRGLARLTLNEARSSY